MLVTIAITPITSIAGLHRSSVAMSADQKVLLPPLADKPTSIQRSLTMDGDYFERRELRIVCTQKLALEDFRPQASEVIPRLYLSDLYTATSPNVLNRLGITHVVSVVGRPWHRYPSSIKHLSVPIEDNRKADLLGYLDATVTWIHHALSRSDNNRVLVHCVWGMSRSASVIVAYLMAMKKMPLQLALSFVRLKRSVVRPNIGFMSQLQMYELQQIKREKRRRIPANLLKTEGQGRRLIGDLETIQS
ncbi:hypothetical protein JAAARDRAFT_209961 [Jaapia argillacea MUCL 33604]|uniref:Uncharacterized protein n=1 Tax=Jaapia argillacea MUCL 33604 TaxID=933084 RepID=A0A067PIF8_9AGAM|nr:hypothetical protein JAAARDRAFT_209961 [Jaapia argillacea MUCL 33604]